MEPANATLGRAVPRVSVVIPTYNRAQLVTRAIDSVLQQTFDDFELIVVDDGSPDETADIVRRYQDSRIRLLRLVRNQGVSRARNAGISNARGEWVAFLDCDDEWLPEKLERQMARVDLDADEQTIVVYCRNYRQFGPQKRKPGRRKELPEGDVFDSLLREGTTLIPSVYVVKRSALIEVGGFDERLATSEDHDCWLRLAQRSHRFVAVQERLVVKHNERSHARLSMDPVKTLQGQQVMDKRWGALRAERLGKKADKQSSTKEAQRLNELHDDHVGQIVASGSRADAWKYVRGMVPTLPWGTRFVAKAIAVGCFGGLVSRIHPTEAPRSRRNGRSPGRRSAKPSEETSA